MNAVLAALLDLKAHIKHIICRYAQEEEEPACRYWRLPDGALIFDIPATREEAAEAFGLDPEDLTPTNTN